MFWFSPSLRTLGVLNTDVGTVLADGRMNISQRRGAGRLRTARQLLPARPRWVTYLLQQVGLLDGLQHVLLGRLLSLAAQQELVQDEVGLLKVKNNVQLADLSL